ncbi:MAG: hypothetical protein NVSMB26_06710 [Beijerinckiaceae bacterium]
MTDFRSPDTKPAEQNASQIASDLAALREDFGKLSSSVAELVKSQANQAGTAMRGAVGDARDRLASTASDAKDRLASKAADAQDRLMDKAANAQDRVIAATADLESTIERNPLMAVLIALFVGLLMGALSRSRR